jgi:hypothetical protein
MMRFDSRYNRGPHGFRAAVLDHVGNRIASHLSRDG